MDFDPSGVKIATFDIAGSLVISKVGETKGSLLSAKMGDYEGEYRIKHDLRDFLIWFKRLVEQMPLEP